MNMVEMIIALIVGVCIAFFGMAGIDYMFHKNDMVGDIDGNMIGDKSLDEIYEEERQHVQKVSIADMETEINHE